MGQIREYFPCLECQLYLLKMSVIFTYPEFHFEALGMRIVALLVGSAPDVNDFVAKSYRFVTSALVQEGVNALPLIFFNIPAI